MKSPPLNERGANEPLSGATGKRGTTYGRHKAKNGHAPAKGKGGGATAALQEQPTPASQPSAPASLHVFFLSVPRLPSASEAPLSRHSEMGRRLGALGERRRPAARAHAALLPGLGRPKESAPTPVTLRIAASRRHCRRQPALRDVLFRQRRPRQ